MDLESLICEALGEASVLFMSQDCKGINIVMPSEELLAIAKRTAERYEGDDYLTTVPLGWPNEEDTGS